MNVEKRPWGEYEVIYRQERIQVKRIQIKPGLRFSLQKHNRRSEKWIIISGRGVATLGKRKMLVQKGSFIEISKGQVHRLHNTGKTPLIFVEVQFGNYLGEDDIFRLEDDFGRR